MCDEARIVTVGGPASPDVAKWLRQQPHDRRITLVCRDEPSLKYEYPTAPSAFRCIEASVEGLVEWAGGKMHMAGVRVQIADHIASDPKELVRLILEEADAAFAALKEDSGEKVSDK